MRCTRPLVRYHGGKWRLAPWIISHFPAHRVYVESFGGGGSVLLRKERSYAEIYNDMSSEIVNLFRVARDHGTELIRLLELTPFARDEFFAAYEPSEDPIEKARRTVIRCGMGFGGASIHARNRTGFRGSATRSGTIPATDWRNQNRSLAAVIDRLRGVVIENKDAVEIIQYHDSPTTLHYCDPPYVHSSRTWNGGKGAYLHEMTDQQHEDLSKVLHGLSGYVVLSGYPSELYDRLYRDWRCEQTEAMADQAVPRTECLWMNPAACQPDLFQISHASPAAHSTRISAALT